MNEVMNLSKEQFQELLNEHDWWYNMSEDHRIWQKGLDEENQILALCRNNPEFKQMYIEKGNSIFKTNQ